MSRRSRRRKSRNRKNHTRIYARTRVLGLVSSSSHKKRRQDSKKKAILKRKRRNRLLREAWRRRHLLASPISPFKKKIRKLHTQINPIKKLKVCTARRIRKEIMHALGKAGKGGQKKPIYRNKNIKCT
jgi:hypothetical protein